jgi:hypothetical protein
VARRQDIKKKNELESEMETLRTELTEIKELLQQVMSGNKYG